MRMSTTQRIVMAALMGATAVACGDMSGPAVDRPVEVIGKPALTPAEASRIAVTLDDALMRLVPADATWSPLRVGLLDLAGALNTGDVPALVLRIEVVRRALDVNPLDRADRNALELTLTWMEEAVTRAAAGN